MQAYYPEGILTDTPENTELTASLAGLEYAMANRKIVEGRAVLCDEDLTLHIDFGTCRGIMPADEVLLRRADEARKDIAVISRVGKPLSAMVTGFEKRGGETVALLSRRLAQEECRREYLSALRPGDLIRARVTHLEPFGAFLDIGCGIVSLLTVDCISVSRISHPRDRLWVGMDLTVAVKSIDPFSGRIYTTLRELLGTWQENAARFSVGQTVTGVLRSVEPYGIFVELAPNLAGLAEPHSEKHAADLRTQIGRGAAVYIKSILPERMKIKLVLIDTGFPPPRPKELSYFIDLPDTAHLSSWTFSPPESPKQIKTDFDAGI